MGGNNARLGGPVVLYDADSARCVEKYSSAVTLSDMEVFIFPELMFSLVLANVMSPRLWKWRDDPWFKGMQNMAPYRRILRVKQYIMNEFAFNLDLDTWGLTTKEKELDRFSGFISESVLAQSNALFGYHGDKHYFDMDIRRHFGLDKYESNIIPYWKTETLEAMGAFKYKDGYTIGAGECVSLAALYASALFVVAGISLNDIYMMATPLHSQDFLDVGDGIVTNNRRIVTKQMWFNGTELSAKARRAIEREHVTIVANSTGYVHTVYEEATMLPEAYEKFSEKLRGFLETPVSYRVVANFLRENREFQKSFQLVHSCCGKPRYIEAEKVYHYEHGSNFKISDRTRTSLLREIDEDEFCATPLPNRIMLDEIEPLFVHGEASVDDASVIRKLKQYFGGGSLDVEEAVGKFLQFCRTVPKLPGGVKKWVGSETIDLDGFSSRHEIVEYLESIRDHNSVADLAFMAYRDMSRAPWKPFLKAAIERNPVCIQASANWEIDRVFEELTRMDDDSIYDATRTAQPDEIWNFRRGDGIEKALCLIAIMKYRSPDDSVVLKGDGKTVCVCCRDGREYGFSTKKNLELPKDEDFILR